MLASETPAKEETILLAMIADRIEFLRHGLLSDSNERPISIIETLYGNTNNNGVTGFETSEDLEAALARIRGE